MSSIIDIATMPIVTTGTTAAAIELGPIQDDSAVQLTGTVVCMSSTGLVRSWTVIRNGKKVGASAAVLVGPGVTVANEADASFTPTIALSLNGRVLQVQCTGVAGATIRWLATGRMYVVNKP